MITISDNEVYLIDDSLTSNQIEIREFIKCFVMGLKVILNQSDTDGFFKWGFNSCRQTSFLINRYLKDNSLVKKSRVISGMFDDCDSTSEYEHYFVITEIENDKILIDYSRTEKPLVFCKVNGIDNVSHLYSDFPGYKNMRVIRAYPYTDARYYREFNVNEYFTHQDGEDLYKLVYEFGERFYELKNTKGNMFEKAEKDIFGNLTFLYKGSYNKDVIYPAMIKNLEKGGSD